MERELADAIVDAIRAATGTAFELRAHAALGGGCINAAVRIDDGRRSYFVKLNQAARAAMFAAEYAGLEELRAAHAVRVPAPVCHGIAAGTAFLVLEYLALGRGGGNSPAELGRQLAGLHRRTCSAYGWDLDNTIGSTPQPNRRDSDWPRFWREQRLGHQLALAAAHGHGGRLQQRGERLLAALPVLLAGHAPPASLLHGDLWSGNAGYLRDGTPVLFDPAVYYGDREADIAMTELFGGFPPAFYHAYREAWPLPAGYEVRRELYNLYHVLNHLNLFGGGYRAQAEGMIDALLGEVA